jgi:hypothetical protein
MLRKRTAAVLASALLMLAQLAAAAEPSVTVTSSPRILYRAVESGCGPNFIPDSPARMFRRADGNMELIAAHFEDWMMLGRNFGSLKASCQSIMDPDEYNRKVQGHLWIQATYTLDGRHIEGLISQDLSRTTMAEGCNPENIPGRCWVNQIIGVSSGDMGTHFNPGSVVASYGNTFPSNEQWHFGFFTASNIVRQGDFYYVVLYQTPPSTPGLAGGMTQSGNCLFRTNTILNPASWRAWTGTGFTYDANRGKGRCALISPADSGPFRSIQYLPKDHQWIALTAGRHQLPGDPRPVPGFYAMTSPDLMHWNGYARVMAVPLAARSDSMDSLFSYPSLIDPDSSTNNFETLDHETAILVFTVHHLLRGTGTMNRDLEFVPVRVAVVQASRQCSTPGSTDARNYPPKRDLRMSENPPSGARHKP